MIKITSKRSPEFYYSPLRYPGGKTFLFPFFQRIIKESGLENVTYVEPFAGGAGAALALLFQGKVKRIVINDLDKGIYLFWKAAVFSSEKFIERISSTPLTVSEWKKQKAIYRNPNSDSFDIGFATFFLNRTNISGNLDGGPIGGLAQKGEWKMDARFNRESLVEKVHWLSLYRDRISVFNKDGLELIKTYLNKENIFIYIDPPYFGKGATLYLNHYKKENHEALANQLNQNPDVFWLLTYDNRKRVKSLYSKRKIINFSLNYNAYEPRRGKEVLIFSDAIAV